MGEVYRAWDTRLERDVALKVLPGEVAGDPERLRRFEQEARAASALNHPNVAHIYDIGEAGGVHYIAMEYVEGESLGARIGRGPLEVSEVVERARQVAEALEAAHEKGVTHRDIKPANIMVTPRGQVKVLDFGLAKINRPTAEDGATQAMTQPGVVMGTMRYMSPEQALGREVDHRTDIFSFGVVLYEMASGKQPFAGTSAVQTLDQILHLAPPPAPGAPEGLRAIIGKCLEKDCEKRYGSARELLADLKQLQRGNEPTVTVPRRRTALVLAAVAVTVALAAGVGVYRRMGRGQIDSVAVLPFANTSGNPEMEYLSDGITDNLINSLSQTPQLKVAARSLSYRHKGKDVDPRTAGQDLKVRAVVTGRVTQRGETLTVQAELLDVEDGSQLWGQGYNRKLADLAAVQDDIGREIVEKLRGKLAGGAPKKAGRRYQDNPEAYQAYLKGRYYAYQYSMDGRKKALQYLQRAIEIDPAQAPAYAALAELYCIGVGPQGDALRRAKAYATKALEMDDSLAEAHTAMGLVKYTADWDWAGAEKEFRRAIELNPNYVWARDWYGFYLAQVGRFEESFREYHRALEIDPLSPAVSTDLADVYRFARQPDRAIEQYHKTLEIDPNFWLGHVLGGLAYRDKGDFQAAIESIEKARKIDDREPLALAALGTVYGAAGRRAEAQRVAGELLARSKTTYVSPWFLALVWARLDQNRAFEWLEKAYEERFWMNFLKSETALDPLRADPRFQELLRRVGL